MPFRIPPRRNLIFQTDTSDEYMSGEDSAKSQIPAWRGKGMMSLWCIEIQPIEGERPVSALKDWIL